MTAPILTNYQNGVGNTSGPQLNTFVQNAQSTAQLRAFVGVTPLVVYLEGIATPGDGGQGNFYWNASAVSPVDDNLNVIVPPAAGMGCWQRLYTIPDITAGTGISIASGAGSDTISATYAFGGLAADSNPALTQNLVGWTGSAPVLMPAQAFAQHGQCKFVYTSSSVCTLLPKNGNNLIINGQVWQIPSAGATLSNSGLSSSTLYYVYATIVTSAIVLVATTTGHTTSTANGVEVETGNAAATLIGMIYVDGSGNFQDAPNLRYTRSWFNQSGISGSATMPIATATDAITAVAPNYAELTTSSTPYPAFFLLWNNERVSAFYQGQPSNGTAGYQHIFLGINQPTGAYTGSGSLPIGQVQDTYLTGTGTTSLNVGVEFGANGATFSGGSAVNEGWNSLRMFGACQSGSLTFPTTRGQANINYITVRSATA